MLNKLILGTVQLGLPYGINNLQGQPSLEQACSLLKIAYNNGIQCLDTAEAYGNAQEVIGHFHRNSTEKFSVISKYKGLSDSQPEIDFQQHFLQNLEQLQVPFLEAYLFHNFNLYQTFSYWPALKQLQAEGYIRKIGVSLYTNEQAQQVAQDERIRIIQLPYNLLDNFSLRGPILSLLKNEGKEVHVRSVFLQGLFYKDRSRLGNLSTLQENLLQLDRLADMERCSIGALAMAYCLRQPLIDRVLIGVETEVQLMENIAIAAAAVQVQESVLTTIDSIQVTTPQLLNPSNW